MPPAKDTQKRPRRDAARLPRSRPPHAPARPPKRLASPVTNAPSPTTTPAAAIAAWPPDLPLAAVWSDADEGRAILASPRECLRASAPGDARDLLRSLPAPDPDAPASTRFTSGWIGWFSYDLGRTVEPAATHTPGAADDRAHPLLELHRCEGAYVFDRRTRAWHGAGDTRDFPDPALLDRQTDNLSALPPPKRPFHLAPLAPETTREDFTARVRRILAYIRAGDVYQVNLAHRLSAPFEGSARALFARLAAAADPRHGVYLESTDATPAARRALCSLSPELFLDLDPRARRLTTRPMKGTRPAHVHPDELLHAPKDRAELNMIVDLMRNDLGRVADPGTVRVEHPRTIETHADSVLQATATIAATLRKHASVADALEAAFPPGSVTGAPKIRAMQIIDELEPARRGPYCGSAGFIADTGACSLNVAIRTAIVTGEPAPGALDSFARATLDYSVGAGIVADSDPDAEWQETLLKAEVMRAAAVSPAPSQAT